MTENVRCPPSEAELLAATAAQIRPFYCRNCGACEGSCRRGLPVSDMLRALMYAEGYGNPDTARREFLQAPAALTRVRCSSCEGCTVCCPHGVRVVERLTRAQGLLA